MRPTILALAAASVVATTAPAQPPAAKDAERWVRVDTTDNTFLVRLAGGPPEQVKLPWAERPEKGEMLNIAGQKKARFGFKVAGGKQFVFHEPAPEESFAPRRFERDDERLLGRDRLMLADGDGRNSRPLLAGLRGDRGFHPAADGKAVYCAAMTGDGWYVFRVPFDGTPPVRLSRVAGVRGVEFRALPDGRVLYRPAVGEHHERIGNNGTLITDKGPAILTDGKTEKTLMPVSLRRLPEIADDGSKLAVCRQNDAGDEVVEVFDLKAGGSREYQVKAFGPDWPCRFGEVKFSPEGHALAVSFEFLPTVRFGSIPLALWRPLQHVGLIWLDGRRNPRVLYELEQQRSGPLLYPPVQTLEWAAAPRATP